jgi:hypothetical protein
LSECGQLYKIPREIFELENRTKPKYSMTHGIKIFIEYYKNLKIFFWIKINKLLKYQLYNFKIKLKLKKQSLFDFLYEIF